MKRTDCMDGYFVLFSLRGRKRKERETYVSVGYSYRNREQSAGGIHGRDG